MLAVTCTKCPNTEETKITLEVCGDGSILLECHSCGDIKRIKHKKFVPQEKHDE